MAQTQATAIPIGSTDWTKSDPRPFWNAALKGPRGKTAYIWQGPADDEGAAKRACAQGAALTWRVLARLGGTGLAPPRWLGREPSCEVNAWSAHCFSLTGIGGAIHRPLGVAAHAATHGGKLRPRARAAAIAAFRAAASRARIGSRALLVLHSHADGPTDLENVINCGIAVPDPHRIAPVEENPADAPTPEPLRLALMGISVADWACAGARDLPATTWRRADIQQASATMRAGETAMLLAEAPGNVALACGFLEEIGAGTEAVAFQAAYGR